MALDIPAPTPRNADAVYFPSDLAGEGMHFAMFNYYKYSRANMNSNAEKIPRGTIILPLPANLATGYSAGYETTEIGVVAGTISQNLPATAPNNMDELQASIGQSLQGIGGLVGDLWGSVRDGAGALVDLITGGDAETIISQVISGASPTVLNLAMDKFTPVAYAGALLGVARNPHLALLYQGTSFRQHNFEYNFVAKNQQESDTLKNLIRTFKMAMSPSFLDSAINDRNIFTYPDEWDIRFFHNGNDNTDNLFFISTSTLTDFQVNYHGQGVPLYFEDTGAPVNVTIKLAFTEVTITTRDEIENEGR